MANPLATPRTQPVAGGVVGKNAVTPAPEAGIRAATTNDVLTSIDDVNLDDASIIAKPLMMPGMLNIKIKRTEYAYRWCNRSAQGGAWLSRCVGMGFSRATKEDVEVGELDPSVTIDGESIIAGDLILMKIPKAKYYGALKYNDERARVLGDRSYLQKKAQSEAKRSFTSDVPFDVSDKVGFFTPSQEELNKKMGPE